MRKTFLALVIFLLGALMACGIKSNPAEKPITSEKELVESQVTIEESWQVEWGRTLQAAKKEGIVFLISARGGEFREVIMRAFTKKYGINIDMIIDSGSKSVTKIDMERMAGLYLQDVQIVGGSTVYVMKNKGFLGKMEPMLILPEVKDPKYWVESPKVWNDEEGYVLMPGVRPGLGLIYNTNLVKRGELESYFDLLNPKWKGKISLDDPTYYGSGQGTFAKIKVIIDKAGKDGEYFWRQIAKQEPTLSRNSIQLLHWLAQGKHAISFGKSHEDVVEAIKGGAPVDAFVPREGTWIASGGKLVVMDKPAHPNAAKVFINWYLSKEGQELTHPALSSQSLRVDVSQELVERYARLIPGTKYFDYFATDEWEQVVRPTLFPLAQEIFSPLLK